MKSIQVNAERDYEVLIECSWLEQLQKLTSQRMRVAIIYTHALEGQIKDALKDSSNLHFFALPDGESAKTAQSVVDLWNWFGKNGFTRSDVVVGIGGGTVTDLTGFAAATWLRGIDWIAVPTTVAGMVDAAIGGKTGINSEFGKNLIGSFNSPQAVIIDTNWLQSLPIRDFAAGIAEVVKCGFIADKEILDLLDGKEIQEVKNDNNLVVELISRSVAVKARVVSKDFKESFEREVLNYGHTLGHAIEKHSSYTLKHGEAISIGLVYAAHLAHLKGLLDEEVVARHSRILSDLGLPITYSRDAWKELYPLLALDKKSRGNTVRFVGISQIGQVLRIEDATESELATAYERISP